MRKAITRTREHNSNILHAQDERGQLRGAFDCSAKSRKGRTRWGSTFFAQAARSSSVWDDMLARSEHYAWESKGGSLRHRPAFQQTTHKNDGGTGEPGSSVIWKWLQGRSSHSQVESLGHRRTFFVFPARVVLRFTRHLMSCHFISIDGEAIVWKWAE